MICSGVAQFIAFGDTGTEFRVFRNIRLPLFGLKDLTNAMAGDQFSTHSRIEGNSQRTMQQQNYTPILHVQCQHIR